MFKNRKRPNWLVRFFNRQWYEITTYGVWHALTHPTYIYIRNLIRPFNHIRISTLPRDYCEVETRLLHGMFQLIVDFVEIEWEGGKSPYHGHIFDIAKEEKEYRESGQDEETIEWQISALKRQNEGTQEIWDLYNWWTKIRPARKDPMDEYDGPRPDFVPTDFDENGKATLFKLACETEAGQKEYRKHCEKSWELEEKWEKEDEEMMIRVIKVRGHLWT